MVSAGDAAQAVAFAGCAEVVRACLPPALRHRLIAEHCGLPPGQVAEALAQGSMADLVASLPKTGRRLAPLPLRRLTQTQKALADSAFLDPERPEDIFAVPARRRGLFRAEGVLPRPDAGLTHGESR